MSREVDPVEGVKPVKETDKGRVEILESKLYYIDPTEET